MQNNKPRRRSIGIRIKRKYENLDTVPDIKTFKHFINCEISPDICPMVWEELEKVDDKDEKRYCKFCENYIYRIDDEETLEKYEHTNKCLAINEDLLENLYGKWDEKVTENYKQRLLISKLFLLFKSRYKQNWKEFKENKYDYEQILKEILKLVLNETIDIKYFYDNNLNLVKVFDLVITHIDDEKIQSEYKSKKNNLFTKFND